MFRRVLIFLFLIKNKLRNDRVFRYWLIHHYGFDILKDPFAQRIVKATIQDGMITQEINNLRFTYNHDTDIGRQLFYENSFEAAEIKYIAEVLSGKKDPVIIDVGANIGLHSISWCKANPGAIAYSLEPSKSTFQLLSKNIRDNDLSKRIFPVGKAASDSSGTVDFHQSTDDAYSSLLRTDRKEVKETYPVEVTTIDGLIANQGINHLDMIKIDVEGLEDNVIEGSMKSLSIFKPDLLVEIVNTTEKADKTINKLIAMGYKAYVFINGEVKPFTLYNQRFYNYYFTFNHGK
jgi:FkbM family methyltransferase